jgi:hypothetical protein
VAIIEITPTDIRELRGAREMDDGVRTRLRRAGEDHRSSQDPPEQAGVPLPEVCRDESGVQAVRGDPGARESAREFAGEQYVASLSLRRFIPARAGRPSTPEIGKLYFEMKTKNVVAQIQAMIAAASK